jgi:glycosyltransferase involved in cell wall biosynthesis
MARHFSSLWSSLGAAALGHRRPDIPLLVVEGRGKADGLAGLPINLSGLTNLHRMANTPDPRDFYRVSRAVLMPSLWRESLGRVPIEAMANRIPVLASDRGALPETLGDAGFVFTIPDRCTPASNVVPTAQEVAPWIAVIERSWDDPEFEAEHTRRALAEARRWNADTLADQYNGLFQSLCLGDTRIHSTTSSRHRLTNLLVRRHPNIEPAHHLLERVFL